MKRVVQHTKLCKRKTNGGCPIALCCYRAKHCQVQEEAARQQAPHGQGGYFKGNPPGIVVGQPQVKQRTIQMGPSAEGPHLIPMNQWTPRYPSNPALQVNPGLRQPSPNMIQQLQPLQVPPDQMQYVVGGQHGTQVLQQQPGLKPMPPPVLSPEGISLNRLRIRNCVKIKYTAEFTLMFLCLFFLRTLCFVP
ncbi:histone acetyltransferase p300-like [Anabrus simplex]|uniref:histone acetyltransferase p300-like n=1 Tax=Anabrus simplex TaxID=316456 RepID=UPI0035A2D121